MPSPLPRRSFPSSGQGIANFRCRYDSPRRQQVAAVCIVWYFHGNWQAVSKREKVQRPCLHKAFGLSLFKGLCNSPNFHEQSSSHTARPVCCLLGNHPPTGKLLPARPEEGKLLKVDTNVPKKVVDTTPQPMINCQRCKKQSYPLSPCRITFVITRQWFTISCYENYLCG